MQIDIVDDPFFLLSKEKHKKNLTVLWKRDGLSNYDLIEYAASNYAYQKFLVQRYLQSFTDCLSENRKLKKELKELKGE